jgi:hypothetical protein
MSASRTAKAPFSDSRKAALLVVVAMAAEVIALFEV